VRRSNGAVNQAPHHLLISIFRLLLVSLTIDAILQESTIYRRRERLSRITDGLGLGDAYGAIIERIKAQGGDKPRLGMDALMWISHAEGPLRVDELCHALAVELGSTNFNSDNIPSITKLLGCCQGLITVDWEASTVRLIHFTLQEYLFTSPYNFSRPHSTMAEICLTYLNSEQVKAIPADRSPGIRDTTFLEYCSMYWGVHARKDLSDSARLLSLELFREYNGHISGKLLLMKHLALDPWRFKDRATGSPFSGLHCASFFGIVEVVTALVEMGYSDINERDLGGYTPVAWAARNGHKEVVRILLGREEVDPDKPDNFGIAPLSHASSNGHERVVKILLRREDVNPDKPDNFGQTPLLFAARNGHERVVEILLGRKEVNPDKPDNFSQAPLSHAASNGHEGVAKVLLRREDVNPDKPDNDGQTPLLFAARNGYEGVVEILLRREDVNPDKPDNSGQTPLLFAARNGHEGVVEMLLGRDDVNPDKSDNFSQAPLLHAASNGHEGVVKILLGREEVNPDNRDNDGRTPLLLAAWYGHEGVVKVLLDVKRPTSTSEIMTAKHHPSMLPQTGTRGW